MIENSKFKIEENFYYRSFIFYKNYEFYNGVNAYSIFGTYSPQNPWREKIQHFVILKNPWRSGGEKKI